MKCEVCGKPSVVHLTQIKHRLLFWFPVKREHHYCLDHSPPEMRDKLPFGPHRTPAEEAALLRKHLADIDEQISDPSLRAEARAEIEQLIADIESGKRRLGDDD